MLQPTSPILIRSRPFAAWLLVAGMAAVAAGLGLPLLLGTFSVSEVLLLVVIDGVCLALLGIGAVAIARRLRSSHRTLWQLARRDELTGVGNYRAMHERLASELARHRRHRREFALILLDLNGFKQINERHGHLEGDRLLAEVGAALSQELRGEDAVFRQGGDEFAVILPEASTEDAAEVATRLRSRVRWRGFGNDDSRPVSAATGFAVFPGDGASSEDLLRVADGDLFATKRKRSGAVA